MTDAVPSSNSPAADVAAARRSPWLGRLALSALVALVVVGVATGPALIQLAPSLTRLYSRPHAPDWDPILSASPVVRIHLAAAVAALILGLALMVGRKGVALHRALGWTWVCLMAATAVTSLFIRHINHGNFSFIHLLTGWTLLSLPFAVLAARRHDVIRHRRIMGGMFWGGLLIAGVFAFGPGRILWRAVFG